MPLKMIISGMLLLGTKDIGAQPVPDKHPPKFMQREVTVVEPELDADGFFPKGPASVCVEGPQRQCYTAPKDFGRNPTVTVVQVEKDASALLFSAASGGVSGFQIHLSLLRPGITNNLENLFRSDLSVSNQSQHAFWNDPAISKAAIFLTADFVWGPDESHYSDHRYMISTYLFGLSLENHDLYSLQDRYMTVRKYRWDEKTDILTSEKTEILARLRRIKAETPR